MGMISRKITKRMSKQNIQICLISRFPLKSSGGNIRDINPTTEGKKEKENWSYVWNLKIEYVD